MRRGTFKGGTPNRGGFQGYGRGNQHRSSEGRFSMQDEAKHTLTTHSMFDKGDQRLRTRPVQFTAGKSLVPSEDLPMPETTKIVPDTSREPQQETTDGKATEIQATQGTADGSTPDQRESAGNTLTAVENTAANTSSINKQFQNGNSLESFFIDLHGNKGKSAQGVDRLAPAPAADHDRYVIHSVTTRDIGVRSSAAQPQSATGEDSSSDGEVILFKGRNHQPPKRQVHHFTIRQLQQKLVDVDISNDSVPEDSRNDSEAAMDDYANNAVAGSDDEDQNATDLLLNSAFSRRALGGSHDEIDMGEESAEGEDDDSSFKAMAGGTNSDSMSRIQMMEDENLARLLAKQDDLGIEGDDLVLFDDRYDQAVPEKVHNPSKAKILSERNLMKSKGLKGPRPSASAVADAFDDFDVMDWNRTSLIKKNKKSLGIELSDSELDAAMQSTWQKDRLKKAAKKQAREELRSQGLLRKNADPNDPRTKYQGGMNLDEIKRELALFLAGTEANLIFPPMDANARKVLHDISNRLKIKSKSAGQGEQRHTTLHRTKFTAKYNAAELDNVIDRIGRRYFPRMDRKGRNEGPRKGNASGANVYEGDIVGGAAPEIGISNRGRTLLEKMGWSSGMALGATENKGIMQPIVHIVKKSKAGLG